MTIFRNKTTVEVNVPCVLESPEGTDRIVHWAGLQLQEPHRAVRELGFVPSPARGVYLTRWHYGSPAQRFGLFPLNWITEINGVAIDGLDSFVRTISQVHGNLSSLLRPLRPTSLRVGI